MKFEDARSKMIELAKGRPFWMRFSLFQDGADHGINFSVKIETSSDTYYGNGESWDVAIDRMVEEMREAEEIQEPEPDLNESVPVSVMQNF